MRIDIKDLPPDMQRQALRKLAEEERRQCKTQQCDATESHSVAMSCKGNALQRKAKKRKGEDKPCEAKKSSGIEWKSKEQLSCADAKKSNAILCIAEAMGGEESSSSAKKNKYHAKKVVLPMPDGTDHEFDSRHEANVYGELYLREKAGEISDLRIQVPFLLLDKQKLSNGKTERAVYYIADFVYTESGKQKVVDAKGYKKSTAYSVFTLKRKLMKFIHDIEVEEV